jgi:hypothetical protein
MRFNKIFLFFLLFCIAACTPQRENMKIKISTFQKPITVLIAQMGDFPKPVYIKKGDQNQKLLDVLISELSSMDVHDALNKCHICETIDEGYFKEFGNTFKKKKIKFIEHKTPFNSKNFAKIDDELIYLAPYDLSVLKNQYKKADYVLILEPIRYFLERDYWGFVPISSPRAVSQYRVYFVNLKNNELEGYYSSISAVDAGGWMGHEPDDLIKHLKEVVKKHLQEGHDYLTKF